MNKLKTVGLTALAGTFAATSAQALEMSVSGGVGITYATSDTTEVTGNRVSFGDSLTFSGSGETDQGWTITASIEADGASSTTYYDDRSITIDMGDSGTVHVQQSGAQGTPGSLVPNTYGSASYSLAGSSTTGKHVADGLSSGAGSPTNIGYSNTIAGISIAAGISPGETGGSDVAVNLKYADLVDGLTISAGMSDLNPSQANGAGEISLSASYVMGGLTVGVTDYQYDDDAANGTDYDAMHYGVSFAVNDDLSVSYDRSISDKSTADTDETINSLQASYTMGSMTVKGHITKADDEGYSAGATDEHKAIAVSWSF